VIPEKDLEETLRKLVDETINDTINDPINDPIKKRYVIELKLLFRDFYSAKSLAELLKVSDSTIKRDLQVLDDKGVILKSGARRNRTYTGSEKLRTLIKRYYKEIKGIG